MTDILTILTAFTIGFLVGRLFERVVMYAYKKTHN